MEWPPDADPIADAARAFDAADPSPLIGLLSSVDPLVSRRGLSVFAELGKRGIVALDAALALSGHPDDMARNALMDGVICYPGKLDPEQASVILRLLNDPFGLVREKAIAFLAAADLNLLDASIGLLNEPVVSEHREGLEFLRSGHSHGQATFDCAVAWGGVWSAYAFASLERMARRGQLKSAPKYAGDDYVPNAVVGFIAMWIRRRKYRRR